MAQEIRYWRRGRKFVEFPEPLLFDKESETVTYTNGLTDKPYCYFTSTGQTVWSIDEDDVTQICLKLPYASATYVTYYISDLPDKVVRH